MFSVGLCRALVGISWRAQIECSTARRCELVASGVILHNEAGRKDEVWRARERGAFPCAV